jgi:type II secretory pathway pseudopilin PulG
VVIIIGILAAIAIPTILGQREKAWTAEATSDLRGAAIAMEEYFGETGSYRAVGYNAFKRSDNAISITVASATTTSYCINLVHGRLQAAEQNWRFDSGLGRPEKAATCP